MKTHPDAWHNRQLDTAGGDEEELHRLIREGEHQQLDFKFRVDSSLKIAKTLCAFANTEGGKLLVGVKDNGRISGIDPEEEFYVIQGAAEVYCKPSITLKTKVYKHEDQLVLEVEVSPSSQRPHRAKDEDGRWRAYLRQDDENFAANRVLVRYLQMKGPTPPRNLMTWREHERFLMEYLRQHPDISQSKYARAARIPLHRAEKTLALFLKWEIIQWKGGEKGIRFSLIP